MKSMIFFLIFLFSAAAMAAPCSGNKDYCYKSSSWNPFSEKGTYFAKGTGRDCNQARQDAEYKLVDEYPNLSCKDCVRDGQQRVRCGVNGGVFAWEQRCTRNRNTGVYTVWGQCDHFNSGHVPKDTRSRCAIIRGAMFCG